MATEGIDGGAGLADCISLPDHLLHTILLRLPDTAAAARTSVLSRRWRRIWAHLPELSFRYKYERIYPSTAAHARVDAALAAHAAGTVIARLCVTLPCWKPPAAADVNHAAAPLLLQFASRRVAGELRISLLGTPWDDDDEEIVLPPCERATAIRLNISRRSLRFQLQPGGAFTALATLKIKNASVDGSELEDVVCSRCPRLKELFLKWITLKHGAPALSMRSDSVERLEIDFVHYSLRLQIIAPKLEILSLGGYITDSHIVAPKLLELSWRGPYDTIRHHLIKDGRYLRRLEMSSLLDSPAAMLMRRFDTVHELQLAVIESGHEDIRKYKEYVENINHLSKCEVLVVRFLLDQHDAIKPLMLHLLNKCADVKKLVVHCLAPPIIEECQCISWGCQCSWAKEIIDKTENNIELCSLELVEIKEYMDAHHKVEFVKLLCQYSATFQKRVTINIVENKHNEYVREKLRNICVPNDKVVINVQCNRDAA